jgi:hypothetical protein
MRTFNELLSVAHLTLDTKVAIVAAIAAAASALFAWLSSRTASRALKLAEQDHMERHAGLSVYLIDGVRCTPRADEQLVAFACSVSNQANAPMAISRIELHVHAFDTDGRVSCVVLTPSPAIVKPFPDLSALPVPLNLQPRTTASGWLCYRIPERVARVLTIDKYELAFISSTGDRTTLSQYLLRNLSDANTKD